MSNLVHACGNSEDLRPLRATERGWGGLPSRLDSRFDSPLSNPEPFCNGRWRIALVNQFANPRIESGFLIVELRQRTGFFRLGCVMFAFFTVLLRASFFAPRSILLFFICHRYSLSLKLPPAAGTGGMNMFIY